MPEDRAQTDLYTWARNIMSNTETMRERRRYWGIVTVIILVVVVVGSYYYAFEPLLTGLFILLVGFFSFGLMQSVLPRPTGTKPQRYAAYLVRVQDLASGVWKREVPLHQFDQAVIRLVEMIDGDLEEYEDDLLATRVFKMLDDLRKHLLKFATIVGRYQQTEV